MFSIGIGSSVNTTELHDIASQSSYVLQAPNYNALTTLLNELKSDTCAGMKKPILLQLIHVIPLLVNDLIAFINH